MGQLKVLAGGNSPQARAEARGRLFEDLIAQVLKHLGFRIDRIPRVNYAGMEIDIEGTSVVAEVPLYAECKCYETEVDCRQLQSFFGNYMTRWFRDARCQGLFIALPGVNSHAKGYYRENCEGNSRITVRLLEEDRIHQIILKAGLIAPVETFEKAIDPKVGMPGEWLILYTDRGLFWAQYVIPVGGALPTAVALFDPRGNLIMERPTIEYLKGLWPELDKFSVAAWQHTNLPQSALLQQDIDEVVEVKGGSDCFEYQFPAAPEYFVGRQDIIEDLTAFERDLTEKRTSSRGILLEGYSGWGKSSVVLASVSRLSKEGHFALAVDSRTASSPQFILCVLRYVLDKFGDFGGILPDWSIPTSVPGFEWAIRTLVAVGKALEAQNKLLFLFFDQFENVLFLGDALKRIHDLFLRLCDAQTNVILGFSWKTDLIGLTSEFPFGLRDSIAEHCKRVSLKPFSEPETNALLDKLSLELSARLRKDLRFLLLESSQNYPWLLKRLCAHVKSQRMDGVSQSDIALGLLNPEELFQEDLRGLSAEEEDMLRKIAKVAPVGIQELSERFNYLTVQRLVNRRLVVRIGPKYDIYWDIFRDYLNSGRLPVHENYIIRIEIGTILKAVTLLAENGGTLEVAEFQRRANWSSVGRFYNVTRYVRLLGLAKVDSGRVTLQINTSEGGKSLEDVFRAHLKERLRRNRLTRRILDALDERPSVTLEEVANILSESCPYTPAAKRTWYKYAQIYAKYLDFADLTILDTKHGMLCRYQPGTEIRERLLLTRYRRSMLFPCIQYSPIERAIVRIVDAINRDSPIDWSGFRKSTIYKALATLEFFGFIARKPHSIALLPKGLQFAEHPELRHSLFAEGALQMQSFRVFLSILNVYQDAGRTMIDLAEELGNRLHLTWSKETGKTNVKIMLDWARHTGLAPGTFAHNPRANRQKGIRRNSQITLL